MIYKVSASAHAGFTYAKGAAMIFRRVLANYDPRKLLQPKDSRSLVSFDYHTDLDEAQAIGAQIYVLISPRPRLPTLEREPVQLGFYYYGRGMEEHMQFINMCEITHQQLPGTFSADFLEVHHVRSHFARPDSYSMVCGGEGDWSKDNEPYLGMGKSILGTSWRTS